MAEDVKPVNPLIIVRKEPVPVLRDRLLEIYSSSHIGPKDEYLLGYGIIPVKGVDFSKIEEAQVENNSIRLRVPDAKSQLQDIIDYFDNGLGEMAVPLWVFGVQNFEKLYLPSNHDHSKAFTYDRYAEWMYPQHIYNIQQPLFFSTLSFHATPPLTCDLLKNNITEVLHDSYQYLFSEEVGYRRNKTTYSRLNALEYKDDNGKLKLVTKIEKNNKNKE